LHVNGTARVEGTTTIAGNLGVGASNPLFPLDVLGAVRIGSVGDGAVALNLSIERSWAFRQLGSGSSTALELASIGGGGNKNFVINTTGYVGIGTTAPEAPLHVVPASVTDPSLILGSTFGCQLALDYGRIEATCNGTPRAIFLNPSGGRVGVGAVGSIGGNEQFKVVNATCDGGTWINASDRNLKENFEPADAQGVLARLAALPIHRWSYTNSPNTRHLGPTAQDFHAAFGLGDNDTTITTVDSEGVALSAIQGLNQKLTKELEQKATEITELKARLAVLEKLMENLSPRGN
jgi:hypothetical protein